MSAPYQDEKLVEQLVTYTLFKDGHLFVVENVPARVDAETGEQYFAPQTVEQLQRILQEKRQPARFIQTPVYEFA
ncbi:MAG: hypothetical protein ACOYYU_16245 [Chloroflexota bacterium]